MYVAKADGTQYVATGPVTPEFAQKIVGGWVELVRPRIAPTIVFLCNEEGHVHNLPINRHASALYGNPIAGDVIVMTNAEAAQNGWA